MAPLEIEQVMATSQSSRQAQCNTPAVAGQPTSLPSGFPSALNSPMSWVGKQYSDEASYAVVLDSEDAAELDSALENFKCKFYLLKLSIAMMLTRAKIALGLDGDLVDKKNFPLPQLSKKLNAMRQEVYNGRGFGLLRGLDVNAYSVDDLTIIYLGVQCYIGNKFGRQDKKGNMLGKCSDLPPQVSSANTNKFTLSPTTRRQIRPTITVTPQHPL